MSARPMYETAADLSRERAIANTAAIAWDARPRKLPLTYGLDFAFVRGRRVQAFAEVKCRTCASSTFPTYMLSLAKLMRARELRRVTGLPFVLIVSFTDGPMYWTDDGDELVVDFTGRDDRDDWQDSEPCAMIPLRDFKPLG